MPPKGRRRAAESRPEPQGTGSGTLADQLQRIPRGQLGRLDLSTLTAEERARLERVWQSYQPDWTGDR